MKKRILTPLVILILVASLQGCTTSSNPTQSANNATSTPGSKPLTIKLADLDALFRDKVFTDALKSKLQLTDQQIELLKKTSGDELAKLKAANIKDQTPEADSASARAIKSFGDLLGTEKADQLMAMALERQSEQPQTVAAAEPTPLKGPNAVPTDTRIVVNIPAFRMDLFSDGKLLKSYKVGIGYVEYPLPTGFRKAEMIIFNPTWTQPNEPWASSPGAVVPAGAAGNPLGPIKIPIGGANLIHGGKALAKIGTFASHGCVGLTNEQVKDFAKVLADGTNTELKQETIEAYLKKRTRTQVVKLSKIVPVELRYETIVIEDGKLHIYRDVYNKKTNTEDNLRAVFEANGIGFETLTAEEKTQALETLNAFSPNPKKQPAPKPTVPANLTAAEKQALMAERKAEAERQRKLRSQKEIVVDLSSLSGKGYPSPKDLNTGASLALNRIDMPANEPTPARPRRNPTPAPQSSPRTSPSPAPQSSPRTSPTPALRSTPAADPPLRSTGGLR